MVQVTNKRRSREHRVCYNAGPYHKSGVYEFYAARYNFP